MLGEQRRDFADTQLYGFLQRKIHAFPFGNAQAKMGNEAGLTTDIVKATNLRYGLTFLYLYKLGFEFTAITIEEDQGMARFEAQDLNYMPQGIAVQFNRIA